jgi:hypothetical protein
MKNYPNIESKKFGRDEYRVGYGADGYAVRIHGDSKDGYIVDGRFFNRLSEVSEYLLNRCQPGRLAN